MEKPNMKTNRLSLLIPALALVTLQACSHAPQRQLDEKLSAEQPVKNTAELSTEAGAVIQASTTITADQKAMLLSLCDTTRARLAELRTESLKLRAVLIRDVVAAKYDAKEVTLIKKRIKNVEDQRLTVTFDAVDAANRILGREVADRTRLMEDLFIPRGALE
jgi:hypothetical protein